MTPAPKRGRGRPPVADEDRRTERVELRATAAELATLTAAAGAEGVGPWLRDVGLRAATKRARRS